MLKEFERPDLQPIKESLLVAADQLTGKSDDDLKILSQMLSKEALESLRRLTAASPVAETAIAQEQHRPGQPDPEAKLGGSWDPSYYTSGAGQNEIRANSGRIIKDSGNFRILQTKWEEFFRAQGQARGLEPSFELIGRYLLIVRFPSSSDKAIALPIALSLIDFTRTKDLDELYLLSVSGAPPNATFIVDKAAVVSKVGNIWERQERGKVIGTA